MTYRIFENGEEINIIAADEDFVVQYCDEYGYTYELIPETPIDPPDPYIVATAEQNYEPGDYLTVDGTLYKVVLPILPNTPITAGTNVEVTTIESEMAQLNKEAN